MVERSLRIRELPDDLLNALREGASESKVLLLANIEDEEVRSSYLKDLDVLTRNQLEKDIDRTRTGEGRGKSTSVSPEDQRIADEIQRSLGLKVKMSRHSEGAESGRLMIEFYTNDDLQEIFRKLVSDA
jgi:hypothetical protein